MEWVPVETEVLGWEPGCANELTHSDVKSAFDCNHACCGTCCYKMYIPTGRSIILDLLNEVSACNDEKTRHLQMLVGLPKSCQRLTVGVLTSLRIRWLWFCSPRWKRCRCLRTSSVSMPWSAAARAGSGSAPWRCLMQCDLDAQSRLFGGFKHVKGIGTTKTRNGIIISVACRPAPFSMICLRMPKPTVQIEVERTKTLLVILPPTDLVGKDASFTTDYKLLTCTCVYEGRRPVCISSWYIYIYIYMGNSWNMYNHVITSYLLCYC